MYMYSSHKVHGNSRVLYLNVFTSYMEISMNAATRHMEIYMYLFLYVVKRYTDISMYLFVICSNTIHGNFRASSHVLVI